MARDRQAAADEIDRAFVGGRLDRKFGKKRRDIRRTVPALEHAMQQNARAAIRDGVARDCDIGARKERRRLRLRDLARYDFAACELRFELSIA